ncbi:hypothetical protein JYU29_16830 [Tianweitania sp. BSSL-BM11]|uniref:Uncharacterized protein n=1 Tax=Tianweitania aestuarii TaxID=2814886 RepID=A0ABS5RZ91_9HYPH|nr:hypothetical protein [Tianweitania aestuarii]MBS9722361.1 hypothetical protein [Tianweitania aestuarii]
MKGLRKWAWKELPVYNGFSHEERVRGWQVINFLMENRLVARPAVCCISGRTDRVTLHSETYYHWTPYALNQSIHLALHRRFRSPDHWRAIVDRYAITGEEWFARLSYAPVDVAAQLRANYGPQIVDIFSRASEGFGLSIPRPTGQDT